MSVENTYMFGGSGQNYGGTALLNGFDLQSKAPLDSRQTVPTYDGLKALVDGNACYEGMIVYVEKDKETYQYQGNTWIKLFIAGTASQVNWTNVQNTPTTVEGYKISDVYTKTQTNSTFVKAAEVVTEAQANKILKLDKDGKLPASVIAGIISIDNLPKGALERCVVVADDTARFALTAEEVQLGDTVKVNDTGKMYFVKDASKLNEEAGYEVYTAGSATSVAWSGIYNKPTTVEGYGISDVYTQTQADNTFVKATEVATTPEANKILKLNADKKLPADITGNAATATNVDWSGVQNKPTDLAGYNIYDEVCDLITTQGGGGNFTGTIDWSNVNDRPVGTNQAELANATLYTKTEIDEQLTPIEKKLDNFGHSEDGYLLYNGHKIAYSSDIPKVDINGDIDTSQLVNTEQLNQFKQDVEDTYAKKDDVENTYAKKDTVYTKSEADSTFLKKTDNVLTKVSWSDINQRPEVLDNLYSNENNRVYFQSTNQTMAYLSDLSSYVSDDTFNKKIQELEEKIAAGGGGSSGGGSATVTPEGTLVFTPAAAKVENGILEI